MGIDWKWTAYTSIAVIATYWFANLLLWFPWSYSAILGMSLMFIAITPIWIYAIYKCLIRYRGRKFIHGAIYTSLIFSSVAIVLDYIFYGFIRDAMSELYHPTTLYGYAFLIVLPFIEFQILKKRPVKKTELITKELVKLGLLGAFSLLAIILIIVFNLKIPENIFEFLTMMFASLIVFNIILWVILGTKEINTKHRSILLLSLLCVVLGMLMGKFGANWGFKWWIYYPIPLIMNLFLPPIILKMKNRQIFIYLLLSMSSAPFIHVTFSFLFNWTEYMPFWKIPYFKTLLN